MSNPSATADRITSVLTREFVAAAGDGVRVIAVTTMSSLVAALAARQLGAPRLSIATGFTTLDAAPVPGLTTGEVGLGTAASPQGPISDTFVAVAQGRVGVVVSPAQLDERGATNLSRVGGTDGQPKVALPGSRGLPDNNDSPSRVWYLFPDHSPRQLVARVDFSSGPPPSPGRVRRLITPYGLFELEPGRGWHAVALFPGISADQVAEATGFTVGMGATAIVPEPDDAEQAALAEVDPQRLRALEFLPRADAARRFAEVAEMEQGSRSRDR